MKFTYTFSEYNLYLKSDIQHTHLDMIANNLAY